MHQPSARRLESLVVTFGGGGFDLDPKTLGEDLEATAENDRSASWVQHELPDERLLGSLHGITIDGPPSFGIVVRLGEHVVPRLRELRFDVNALRADEPLRRQSELTALTALLPVEHPVSFTSIAAKKLRSLTWMVNGDRHRQEVARMIGHADFLPHLETLTTNARLDASFAQALGERAIALEELELRGGGATPDGLIALAESGVASRLRVIRILQHDGSPSASFLQGERFERLETLELDRFVFDDTSSFGGPSLVDLVLRESRIDAACARRLVKSPGLAQLYRPVFDDCAIFHAARGLAHERWPDAVFR